MTQIEVDRSYFYELLPSGDVKLVPPENDKVVSIDYLKPCAVVESLHLKVVIKIPYATLKTVNIVGKIKDPLVRDILAAALINDFNIRLDMKENSDA